MLSVCAFAQNRVCLRLEAPVKNFLRDFVHDEAGASLPEFAVLLGLILAVSVATLTGMGASVTAIFSKVNTMLASAATGSG